MSPTVLPTSVVSIDRGHSGAPWSAIEVCDFGPLWLADVGLVGGSRVVTSAGGPKLKGEGTRPCARARGRGACRVDACCTSYTQKLQRYSVLGCMEVAIPGRLARWLGELTC